MSTSDQAGTEESKNELARLDAFVKQLPQGNYTIDQHNKQVCRQLPNGQEECKKLELEYTEMFSEMQRLGFFCALPLDPSKTHMECRRV